MRWTECSVRLRRNPFTTPQAFNSNTASLPDIVIDSDLRLATESSSMTKKAQKPRLESTSAVITPHENDSYSINTALVVSRPVPFTSDTHMGRDPTVYPTPARAVSPHAQSPAALDSTRQPRHQIDDTIVCSFSKHIGAVVYIVGVLIAVALGLIGDDVLDDIPLEQLLIDLN